MRKSSGSNSLYGELGVFQFRRFSHNAWEESIEKLQADKIATITLITQRVHIEKTLGRYSEDGFTKRVCKQDFGEATIN